MATVPIREHQTGDFFVVLHQPGNGEKYCMALAEFCVILESIDLNCAEGCRIIRGAGFLEDIRYFLF